MKKYYFYGLAVLAMFATVAMLNGCTKPDPTKTARLIKDGTAAAVALSMMAIPDDAEAVQACKEAMEALDKNVLPILNGDEKGLVDGLKKILSLEALNNPKLSKVKLILEAALPILEEYIPKNLADKVTEKLDPEIKAYLIAFFEGARKGLADYLGDGTRGSKYQELKKKLAA